MCCERTTPLCLAQALLRIAFPQHFRASSRSCTDRQKHTTIHAGVILDPVYSGKAVYQMVQQMQAEPDAWRGKVLFVHTGGLLGTYDKTAQLQPLVEALGKAHRLQVPVAS